VWDFSPLRFFGGDNFSIFFTYRQHYSSSAHISGMQSSVKSALLIIIVALILLGVSVFGFPEPGEFFHTQGHFSYYVDEPYTTIPSASTWEHILNATGIDNQSARLVLASVQFNSISEHNDTEYRLDFLANTSFGREREYGIWGTLNRSSQINRVYWRADDPDSWRNGLSSFNRHMSHPSGFLTDIGQMNFSCIGYPEETLMGLDFTTMGPKKFTDDENFALYVFANGTFIPLSEISLDPTGHGSVLWLTELTSIDPPGGMTGSSVAVIVSPSFITPSDRIVFLNHSELRVPKSGPRLVVVPRPQTAPNHSIV